MNYPITIYEAAKKSLAVTLVASVLMLLSFLALEPTVTQAITATDSVTVNQAVTADITITAPPDINLTALSSSNNTAVASTTWTVTTNNSGGYTLSVNASQAPALKSASSSFTDYVEAATGTPESWSISGNGYDFGFSAMGSDTLASFGGTTVSSCASGGQDPNTSNNKWEGFNGTTDIQIANKNTVTAVTGDNVSLCVATEQKGVFAPSGNYTATVTATAVTN
jgi:hypothetical protein